MLRWINWVGIEQLIKYVAGSSIQGSLAREGSSPPPAQVLLPDGASIEEFNGISEAMTQTIVVQ